MSEEIIMFLNDRENESQYVSGLVRIKYIKEGPTYEEFRRIIS